MYFLKDFYFLYQIYLYNSNNCIKTIKLIKELYFSLSYTIIKLYLNISIHKHNIPIH
jgi:hypothetical protein